MIWTHAAAALLAAVLAFGSGWQVRAWKAGNDDAARLEQQLRDTHRRAEHADRAAAGNEQQRAALRRQVQIITREVDRVVDRPIYRSECLDADGLRLIAIAIGTAASASQPAPAVPGPDAAD